MLEQQTLSAAAAPSTQPDTLLSRAKEVIAALIALSIIVSLVVMLAKAFGVLNSEEAFRRVKDLLLFINPLVGVVIGYYFNKVSTEARAEKAEATAQTATKAAEQAETGRKEAESKINDFQAEAETARQSLKEIIPAAEELLKQTPPPAMPEADAGSALGARFELQRAVERARALAR